jgi:hypothetical protein
LIGKRVRQIGRGPACEARNYCWYAMTSQVGDGSASASVSRGEAVFFQRGENHGAGCFTAKKCLAAAQFFAQQMNSLGGLGDRNFKLGSLGVPYPVVQCLSRKNMKFLWDSCNFWQLLRVWIRAGAVQLLRYA